VRRARDGTAQSFELIALICAAVHRGMQVEAVRIGAQAVRDLLVPAGHRAQAQHLLSGARTQHDPVRARGRLQ
jgi:hypothetical protein